MVGAAMTRHLIFAAALLAAGVASGQWAEIAVPPCVQVSQICSDDCAGGEFCFDFIEAEKRIRALEEKVKRLERQPTIPTDAGWCNATPDCEWTGSHCICTTDVSEEPGG